MRTAAIRALIAGSALVALAPAAMAQRQVAAPITDPADPKFVTAQTRKMGGVMPPEQLALTFEHLDLATKVYPDQKRIESTATLTLTSSRPVPVLILDMFPKFSIASISVDGRTIAPTAYSNPDGQLRITLPNPIPAGKRFVARVVFSGTPPLAKRPPWEGGTTWTTTPDGKSPWIDTSLWGGGCDLLYPCLDHPTLKPATTDLHYTVPTGLMAVGNGKLVSKTEAPGWTTWNWAARSIHTYGSVLDVGPYKVMEGDYKSRFGNTIPMRFYYLPGEEAKAAELFAEFPRTLEFWEAVIGPYPWADQKMGVIRVPFSGLENQTMVGYSNDYPKTPFGWDWLMNHEFGHEWFANQLSAANYDDLWLHEGLGSYAQPLLSQYQGGEIDYMAQLKSQRAGIRNEQPLVSGAERDEKWVYADPTGPRGDIYPKGSWVAHTLRQLIGDDAFFKSIRILVYGRDDPKPGNFTPQFGTTQGFLKIVNQVTGKDYKWFFDAYLYKAGLPKLVRAHEGGMLKLRWQTPDNVPFPMPLDVRVDGRTVTLPMADGTGQIAAGPFAAVTIDPGSKILMQSDAIDKYQAWQASQRK
ncbi:M1 family metallopeptidase [Sphingomonas sp.]|uniref:M1 family metallopeptidase n=1 Tax=Sphingomonas sp. TaxID=28214 RepID=UPI002C820BEF|nr:M1 family metallopeptidase [Sphingomonas sp.]HWK36734.1 M1 family metallopeptidase [Sphingomonas sp.]